MKLKIECTDPQFTKRIFFMPYNEDSDYYIVNQLNMKFKKTDGQAVSNPIGYSYRCILPG